MFISNFNTQANFVNSFVKQDDPQPNSPVVHFAWFCKLNLNKIWACNL